MADNTTLPGTGEVYAADDIGGVKHQRVKLSLGTDGSAQDWKLGQQSMANSASVAIASDQSAVPTARSQATSTTVSLTSGLSASFNRQGYAMVGIALIATINSSVTQFRYEVSHDNTTFYQLKTPANATIVQAVTYNATAAYDVPPEAMAYPYLRVAVLDSSNAVVTGDSTATAFRFVASS